MRKWLEVWHALFILALLCRFAAASASPEIADPLDLVERLRDRDFEALERELEAYQEAYEAGRLGEDRVEGAFLSFANSAKDLETLLDAWVITSDSYSARLARGVYYWNLAMLAGRVAPDPTHEARPSDTYFAHATADLAASLGQEPALGVAYGFLVQIATERGDPHDVIQIAQLGVAANPRTFVVRRRYLDSLRPWRYPKPDEAFTRIDAFIDTFRPAMAENPELRLLEGYPEFVSAEQLAHAGARRDALEHYERALSFGSFWLYRHSRGVNHYRLGNFRAALADFDRVLETRPQSADTLGMRARTLRALGRVDAAIADWERALALNPRDPLLLLPFAYLLRDEQRFEGAVGALTTALELGSFNEYLWDARGRIFLYDLKEFDEAVIDLRRATELNPTVEKYWFNYGLALYQNDDCEAIAAFARFLDACRRAECPDRTKSFANQALESMREPQMCPQGGRTLEPE